MDAGLAAGDLTTMERIEEILTVLTCATVGKPRWQLFRWCRGDLDAVFAEFRRG